LGELHEEMNMGVGAGVRIQEFKETFLDLCFELIEEVK